MVVGMLAECGDWFDVAMEQNKVFVEGWSSEVASPVCYPTPSVVFMISLQRYVRLEM